MLQLLPQNRTVTSLKVSSPAHVLPAGPPLLGLHTALLSPVWNAPKTFCNGDGPSREPLGVPPGEEIRYQPGFGNRNLFEWKNRAMAQGKVTRSNGKYYRAFPETEAVN